MKLNAADDRRLDRLASLLATSEHNLVAKGEREVVRERHVDESAALLPHLPLRAGVRWLDLGTGGGLPGLALAILRPDVHWVLVDATAKKVRAVEGFRDELELTNVEVAQGRAETLARQTGFREAFDGVVSRAVARLVVVAELSRGFLRPHGIAAAVKGPRWSEELEEAREGLRELRFTDIHSMSVPDAVRPTWLVTMRANGPAPRRFPRRDGIPLARPLGG